MGYSVIGEGHSPPWYLWNIGGRRDCGVNTPVVATERMPGTPDPENAGYGDTQI